MPALSKLIRALCCCGPRAGDAEEEWPRKRHLRRGAVPPQRSDSPEPSSSPSPLPLPCPAPKSPEAKSQRAKSEGTMGEARPMEGGGDSRAEGENVGREGVAGRKDEREAANGNARANGDGAQHRILDAPRSPRKENADNAGPKDFGDAPPDTNVPQTPAANAGRSPEDKQSAIRKKLEASAHLGFGRSALYKRLPPRPPATAPPAAPFFEDDEDAGKIWGKNRKSRKDINYLPDDNSRASSPESRPCRSYRPIYRVLQGPPERGEKKESFMPFLTVKQALKEGNRRRRRRRRRLLQKNANNIFKKMKQ